jgi:Smr domain
VTVARRARDELRFGAERTLNLRDTLPTAAEALRRCDAWLRSQQVRGAREVLVVTGRGSHSPDGVPVLKPAIEKLLHVLRRRGVVDGHVEHNPGAFAVTLAPLRALNDAPARRRDPARPVAGFAFAGLDASTQALLREAAERALHSLGVTPDDRQLTDEMHRQVSILADGLRGDAMDPEQLRAALRRAIAEYD